MNTFKEIEEYKKQILAYEEKIEELKLKIKFLEKNVEMGITNENMSRAETFLNIKKIADEVKKNNKGNNKM